MFPGSQILISGPFTYQPPTQPLQSLEMKRLKHIFPTQMLNVCPIFTLIWVVWEGKCS